MTNTTTAINPDTGVEYYATGPNEGHSVKRYVAVTDGQVRDPNGGLWPFNAGAVHDQPADYFEYVPFQPVPFDERIFVVDNEKSGWNTIPFNPKPPAGHPQGRYERTEVIKRRSVDELKVLVDGYYQTANNKIWPQETGYEKKIAFAQQQIASGNRLQTFVDLVERDQLIIEALLENDARKAQLYAEIDTAGENGTIDFNPEEGWITGI